MFFIIAISTIFSMSWSDYLRFCGLTFFLWISCEMVRRQSDIFKWFVLQCIAMIGFFFIVDTCMLMHESGYSYLLLLHVPIIGAGIFLSLRDMPKLKWCMWDWVSIFLLIFLIILFLGVGMVYKQPTPYGVIGGVILGYGFIRFILLQQGPVFGMGKEYQFAKKLRVICLVGCGVGFVKMSVAWLALMGSNLALAEQIFQTANKRIELTEKINDQLQIEFFNQQIVYHRFRSLVNQGLTTKALKLLGIDEDRTVRLKSHDWVGPSGGTLYKNVSCWQDLYLATGKIEVTVWAKGQSAIGQWPLMEIRLNNILLGKVEVNSSYFQAYSFETPVIQGFQRLEIAMTNDLNQGDIDRNLWVGRAELNYRELEWD